MLEYRIAAVSRLTGLPADTIRKWENRYRAVRPRRDARGIRRYTQADVDRLLQLAAASKLGCSIGEASALAPAALAQLIANKPAQPHRPATRKGAPGPDAFARAVLSGLERSDGEQIDRMLTAAASLLPTTEFVFDVMSPLFKAVGESWRRGTMDISQEHLCSAVARSVLGNVVRRFGAQTGAPLMLFTTPAGEPHEFGIMLASLLAASEGLRVHYLGPDMPASSIARAAAEVGAQAVVLGAVRSRNKATLTRSIKGLVNILPPGVELWLGGKAAERARAWSKHPNVIAVTTLQQFAERASALRSRSVGER